MSVSTKTTPSDLYALELERCDAALKGRQPAWLKDARVHAMSRFQALGFPTTADEEWRFTSVAPIAQSRFVLAGGDGAGRRDEIEALRNGPLRPFLLDGIAGAELAFVNGRFAPELSRVPSLPRGVRVGPLASALADGSPSDAPALVDSLRLEAYLGRIASPERRAFTALNTAFLTDGALVYVPDGTLLEAPIHLLFISRPDQAFISRLDPAREAIMSHPRVLVVVGKSARATIIESYVTATAGLNGRASGGNGRADAGAAGERAFTNAVSEIIAGENAVVEHYRIQREDAGAYHVATTQAVAKRDAVFSSHAVSFGGALVRNDVVAVLDGEGIECTLNGLYLGDRSRLVDNHTTIDHAKPHCGSREIYKGILADRARAVFNGKIIVRPDAQKTDAKQTNKALLLSEDAQINTKPQLEIFANDVKCTHGAAVGQMDEDAIFYLRSRGLSHGDARNLLIHAFAQDVLNRMPLEGLRARMESALLNVLEALPKGVAA